jgi:outer membrane protein OmpA-like peptidoglycan-associated protein
MINFRLVRALPLGLLLMGAACASDSDRTAANNPDNYYNNTEKSVGYSALENGDYATAAKYFDEARRQHPGDPFIQLNLAAALQRQGFMDRAEPLYRAAMVTGDDVLPVDTTESWASGMPVDQIACRNLEMGLRPASTQADARPCQQVAAAQPETTTVITQKETKLEPVFVPVATPARPFRSENIYFGHDSATLNADAMRIVQKTAQDATGDSTLHVRLIGKADRSGPADYNQKLSDRRANAARDALIRAGLPSQRVSTSWVGEQQPPVDTADGVREPRNRVVEVYYSDFQQGPVSSR